MYYLKKISNREYSICNDEFWEVEDVLLSSNLRELEFFKCINNIVYNRSQLDK